MTDLYFHVGYYVASSILTLLIITSFLLHKKKQFISTDQKPELLQYFPVAQSRPVGAVKVNTGLHIKSFPEFDLIKNTFTMDALIWFEFNPSLVNLETIKEFSFERSTILYKSEPEIKFRNNLLLAIYHIQVKFNTNLDYTYFPVNDHRLFLVLDNETVSPQELIYNVRDSSFTWSNDIHTHDWFITKKSVETGYNDLILESFDSKKKMSHPRVLFSLDLARAGLRKAVLIFFPILVFLFLTAYTLTMHPDQITFIGPPIYVLAITAISGLLFYRFIIESISPSVGYFTLGEYFYITSLTLQFVIFLLNLLHLEIGPKYPVFFDVFNFISFVVIQLILIGVLCYLFYYWNPGKQFKRIKPITKPKTFKIPLNQLTLTHLMQYISKHPEFPPIDNENYLNPDYSTFYKQYIHGYWINTLNKLSYRLGLKKPPAWTPELFNQLLSDLVDHPISDYNGDYIAKLNPPAHSRVIIFGDLHGAFHCLVRDLNKLKEMEVIDDFLTIKSSKDYFIFNGNAIDRSPYVLETLTVIMQLMKQNPTKIVYIKGNHENNELWTSYQTGIELKIKTKYVFKDDWRLLTEYLKRFFNTLPLALYLQSNDDNRLVRLSHYHSTELPYAETDFYDFIATKTDKIISFAKLENHFFSQKEIYLDSVINSGTQGIINQTFRGLQLLTPQKGATAWSILSSPTLTYGMLYQFFYDTFVILDIDDNIHSWMLTLYYQDVRKLSGYKTQLYSVIYGIKIDDPKHFKQLDYRNTLVVGCTLDLSKTSSVLGERIRQGLNLGIMEQNHRGGIKNCPIRFIPLDDEYTPHLARKNIFTFLNVYQTSLILSPLGTPTTEAFLPLIKQEKILVLFPYTGATIFRNPELSHLVHFRTSYANEARALITHLVKSLAIKRVALFYQNDSYGLSPLEGAKKTLKQLGIEEWLETPYQRNNPNIEDAARKIIEFNPEAILFFSTNAPSIALIHRLGVATVADKVLMGVSFLTDVFRKFLHTLGLELIISRVIPNIYTAQLPIIDEFKSAIPKHYRGCTESEDSFEAYINARIFAFILDSIPQPFTKEKIITQVESVKDLNFGGLELNFNPQTRELSQAVWIDLGKDQWIKFN